MGYFERFYQVVSRIDVLLEEALSELDPEARVIAASVLGVETATGMHSLVGRSKRLRGTLFLLVHDGSGCTNPDCRKVAASLELVHVASLIVDDLQDGHITRWDRPTLWISVGSAKAINVAIQFLALSQKLADEAHVSGLGLPDTILRMSSGQMLDLKSGTSPAPTWVDYLSIVNGKTSALLECAAHGASHRLDLGSRARLKEYARALGTALQLQDDLADLVSDHLEQIPASNAARFLRTDLRDRSDLCAELQTRTSRYVEIALEALVGCDLPRQTLVQLRALVSVIGRLNAISV